VIITFDAEIWTAPGMGAWHFVSLPADSADEIRATVEPGPGFGSIRVSVAIDETEWQTSIFPDSKRGTYVLPVKKAVRRAVGAAEGDVVTVTVEIIR
jgi:hypothetical protein